MFDVGALIFKIQTAGAQMFQRDMAQADQAVKKVEGSSKSASTALAGQGKATDDLGGRSRKAAEDQKKQAQATEAQIQTAKGLSLALIAGGLAVTAMVGLSVAKFAEFDQGMSNVRAATMATAEEQRALGDAALEAGADTAYSATEAAAAQEELAKAGQSVSQIVNGSLNGALSLAAAGQLAVARSAEIMATTLTQFRLPAEQAARVADILAAGAGKAQGSVDDLSLALSYVGPLAGSVGLSIEETAGTIAYFATQGVIGEKAGTALRGVLASLQAPSAAANTELERYGITVFDAQGNMLSLSGIAEQLRSRLGGLSEQERLAALGRIFGNESLNAATLLYEGGAKAVDEWTAAVDDTGYAAEQAAIRQDNLAGDIEKLGGALDTALIKTGSSANDVLRDMVQAITLLVDWYGELPEGVQTTTLVVGVFTGALLLASGATVGLRAKLIELGAQFKTAEISMTRTAAIGGAVGLALAGVITVVGLLAQRQAEARQRAEAYADALEQGEGAARSFVAEQLTAEESWLWVSRGSAADAAEKFGISLDTLADAAQGNKDALAELSDVMKAGQGDMEAAQRLADEHGLSLFEVSSASTRALAGIEALQQAEKDGARITEQKNEITSEGVEETESAADAYLEAASGAEELSSQLSELIDEINEANGVGQDAITSNARYQEALAGISGEVQRQRDEFQQTNGTLDGFSLSLDEATVAGSANAAMLADVASNAQDAALKQFELDQRTMSAKDASDKYYGTLAAQRQAFEESARAAGFNADEVQKLADKVFGLPDERAVAITAETAQAQDSVEAFMRRNKDRRFNVYLDVINTGGGGGRGALQQADGGVVKYFAGGGVEHHVAQIARAGDWRVWAEPETGGESYIPHAPSKRARSEAIMAETAAILGGVYIPAGAARFADGSPAASSPAPAIYVQSPFSPEYFLAEMAGAADSRIRAHDAAQARVARGRHSTI
ncbi:TP901 family phage tail tape measure protein [Microbacterium sp. SLBN-154]|uniref:phage tail tape measure protein n=1 Tax=Microbacterium sp. SLBN-154 TaxID=2768458 RepID=UPI00114DB2FE|nr:phage tail tape measure protein [Microbacterium sp. SLBN-154]TQK19100.1 TP901 family phage tail tape measure protein [Microbacterium sp. SLBN-154]